MATYFLPPYTGIGVDVFASPPLSPSSPEVLSPQQYAVLSAAMAQVCSPPAAMAVNTWPPATACAESLHELMVTLPSSPWLLEPQQYAAPPEVRAHVWSSPAARVANDRPPAETRPGTESPASSGRPSCAPSFAPQQEAIPSESAQVWAAPAATADTVEKVMV